LVECKLIMPGVESELGPLWESDPKSSGFRVSIPDPGEMFSWVEQTAFEHASFTRRDIIKRANKQVKEFITGQSQRFFPNAREWKIGIGDELFSSIRVELMAGYSSGSGKWGDVVIYAEPSSQSVAWQIPARSSQIAKGLHNQGIDALARLNEDGSHAIIIPEKSGSVVIADLGFVSLEEAKLADSDYDPNYIDSIIIRLENLPISMIDFLKGIQHLQIVTSHLVDSIYRALNMEPPNMVFELSEQSELR